MPSSVILRIVAFVRSTWRNIPKYDILHSHHSENLKSYKLHCSSKFHLHVLLYHINNRIFNHKENNYVYIYKYINFKNLQKSKCH
jgi:hypothetical protein